MQSRRLIWLALALGLTCAGCKPKANTESPQPASNSKAIAAPLDSPNSTCAPLNVVRQPWNSQSPQLGLAGTPEVPVVQNIQVTKDGALTFQAEDWEAAIIKVCHSEKCDMFYGLEDETNLFFRQTGKYEITIKLIAMEATGPESMPFIFNNEKIYSQSQIDNEVQYQAATASALGATYAIARQYGVTDLSPIAYLRSINLVFLDKVGLNLVDNVVRSCPNYNAYADVYQKNSNAKPESTATQPNTETVTVTKTTVSTKNDTEPNTSTSASADSETSSGEGSAGFVDLFMDHYIIAMTIIGFAFNAGMIGYLGKSIIQNSRHVTKVGKMWQKIQHMTARLADTMKPGSGKVLELENMEKLLKEINGLKATKDKIFIDATDKFVPDLETKVREIKAIDEKVARIDASRPTSVKEGMEARIEKTKLETAREALLFESHTKIENFSYENKKLTELKQQFDGQKAKKIGVMIGGVTATVLVTVLPTALHLVDGQPSLEELHRALLDSLREMKRLDLLRSSINY